MNSEKYPSEDNVTTEGELKEKVIATKRLLISMEFNLVHL
jgi:hypothetical protein